jgi:hypothetical protein
VFKHPLEPLRTTILPTTLEYQVFFISIYHSDTIFINGLLVSSLFCYTALLYLHQCLPAHFSLHSMFFFLLCSLGHVHSMHYSSSLYFSYYTMPPACLNHSQQPLISSLFYVFILSMHLLHPLFTMLLHSLPTSSALPDHHSNSSSYLAFKTMRPSSLGVMPRFLSLSSSRDSSSSLSQSSSFPLL